MPFQKDIQNKTFLEVPLFVYKIFHVQKGNDMHMAGYTLIRRSLLYDSALHDLVLFPVYSQPAHR